MSVSPLAVRAFWGAVVLLSAPPVLADMPTSGPPAWHEVSDLPPTDGCDFCPKACPPTTLFDWRVGPPETPDDCERFGKFKDETIVTDRPDFTEASTTVGRGVLQIETGYTYVFDDVDGATMHDHSLPETLLRMGMFAEWFEFRVAWNYVIDESDDGRTSGTEDLYLGMKLALTKQKGCLPEMAILPQMTVPLGGPFTAKQVMPGVNWLYSWEVTDRFSFAGSTQANRIVGFAPLFLGVPNSQFFTLDDAGDEYFVELAQSLAGGLSLTDELGCYAEWYTFIPIGGDDSSLGNQHYINGGFTYLVTNDLQLDIRAGFGLTEESIDFFSGTGFSVRF